MQFQHLLSKPNTNPWDQIQWTKSKSQITEADGTVIFEMLEVEHPVGWSKIAVDILAQKYFRKAGVPTATFHNPENNFQYPKWLSPSLPDSECLFGPETSAKQVFHRLAGAWTYWGWKEGIFKDSPDPATNARIFYCELYLILAKQLAAPNSPQWFNTGLHWAYGITGSASGQWAIDNEGQPYETPNAYERPQPHACFIQPVTDDLVNPGGIMDLWSREVRLFKQGSGTGSNFSNIRAKGERLSGGGISSGLMSFLEIGDTSAKSIKSGGVTRRAAKMCVLDLDHPEILDFIRWKSREEYKAYCLHLGSRILNDAQHIDIPFDLSPSIQDRINAGFDTPIMDITWQGEAVTSVQGQNSNNSVRVTNKFLDKILNKNTSQDSSDWALTNRTDGEIHTIISSKFLWHEICKAAWASGDPGIQFEDEINKWHTCKADGRINASNPCSEYLFLDNTACNLASLNLCGFLNPDGSIDTKTFLHVIRLMTTVLEISVFMASFPSKEIAIGSYNYRTLGLGYANLGGLLMRKGLPYDSHEGRSLATCLTAILHGQALLTSIEMGKALGPFPRWEANRESCDEVLRLHINHLEQLYFNHDLSPTISKIHHDLDREVTAGNGPRNAQVTNIAPTGTISFAMDCDTTGIEPSISLISFKSLAGGGDLRLENQAVSQGLTTLGYTPAQILSILQHIKDSGTIEGWTINGRSMPEDHLAVFDCANPGNGQRYISYLGHLKMVAAVQPFISGGISKTINLPNHATIKDVSYAYLQAHTLGIKSVALFRDGSKLDQPLKSKLTTPTPKKYLDYPDDPEPSEATIQRWRFPPSTPEPINIKITPTLTTSTPTVTNGNGKSHLLFRGERKRLPNERQSITLDVSIDGNHLYMIHSPYSDGSLAEIFLDISKEGSTIRSLLQAFAKSVSIGLQYGVPLDRYVRSFVYTKFEPSGIVQGHDNVKFCSSILDFVFRHLAIKYLHQHEYSNVSLTAPQTIAPASETLSEMVTSPAPTQTLTLSLTSMSPLEECPNCHHLALVRTGTCTFCRNCHSNSGCG